MTSFMEKCHPSIHAFLRDCPQYRGPVHQDNMDINRAYPDPERWYDYSRILTLTNCWGNEIVMTNIAKHFLGLEVAVIFPKFYLSEWPKIYIKESILELAESE